mmetsp:Transcript_21998/g.41994  ORF Transcript_21998/g.41994 Transcript_21998/m.41994 type:complete len:239 (+) Transcript_21998:1360-2076(+)
MPHKPSKVGASKHDAKSTFSLRARTDTWLSTSGMSGVSTATHPSGISSSPETRRDTRMVGRSYVCICTTARLSTTSTYPLHVTGLITCQAPRSAAWRSMGSSLLSRMESGAAPPPRITSSEKTAVTCGSTFSRGPMASAAPWKRALYASPVLSNAVRIRSITALALRAQPSSPRFCVSIACCHSFRHSTSSSLECVLMHRLSSASALPCMRLLTPVRSSADTDPSITVRAVCSSARSR